MSLLGEVRRRKMFQVAAVYAVVAWLVVQIVATVEQPLNLPDWFDTAVIVLMGAGFPVTLVISWAFNVTPEGLVRDEGRTPARPRGGIEYLLIGLLLVAAGWIGYRELTLVSEPSPAATERLSLAVLPFANLSADPAQEFISDGLTEEISFALSKVQGLQLVGRTSAMQFKDAAQDLREIGRALGATHLLEGSVQTSGTRVRITPRLIRAASGVEVWTDQFNDEMTDVFAMQEEIARAVATSLQVPLGLDEGERLVANREIDADDYREYLRARNLFHLRGFDKLNEAIDLLRELVERNPDYAPAWALLAQSYNFVLNFDPAWFSGDFERLRPRVAELGPLAEQAARRAITLDPTRADGYYTLALALEHRGELLEAEEYYEQAALRDIDEDDPDLLHLRSRLLMKLGYLDEALSIRERLRDVDPFVGVYNSITAFVLWELGRDAEAIAIGEDLPPLHRGYALSRILASNGRYDEAADLIESESEGLYLPGTVEEAVRLLRAAPAEVASAESLPKLGLLAFAFLHVGAPERALEPHEDGVVAGYSVAAFNGILWHRSYAAVRRTERFKTFLRAAGIVEYWRERGWPENFCRPVDDDFVCE